MKIAQIVCTYPPYFGGMGNSTFHLAEGLVKNGHEVSVFTPYKQKESDSTGTATVLRVPASLSYGNGGFFPKITHTLNTFDIVHLQYPFFGVAGAIKRFKEQHPHIPLVTTYHMDPRGSGLMKWYMQWYAKHYMPKVLNISDAIIASTFDFIQASEAASLYKKYPEKWYEVPFGVDTTVFHPKNSSRLVREQFRAVNTHLGLFVGGMDKAHFFKGVPVLLEAIALMKQPMQWILVGDGNKRKEYENYAASLGIIDRVHFVGAVSNETVATYYATADCTVLPSVSTAEAFGMVLLESFASGTPVVASDLPGVRTIARCGGQIAPISNAPALAKTIASVIEQKDVYTSDRLHAIAQEKFSWGKHVQSVEKIYTAVSSVRGVL